MKLLIVFLGGLNVASAAENQPKHRDCFDFLPTTSETLHSESELTVKPQLVEMGPYPMPLTPTPAHFPPEMTFEITLNSKGEPVRVCGPPEVRDTKKYCVSLGQARYLPARIGKEAVATLINVKLRNPLQDNSNHKP